MQAMELVTLPLELTRASTRPVHAHRHREFEENGIVPG
jgi:hypothetical protein